MISVSVCIPPARNRSQAIRIETAKGCRRDFQASTASRADREKYVAGQFIGPHRKGITTVHFHIEIPANTINSPVGCCRLRTAYHWQTNIGRF